MSTIEQVQPQQSSENKQIELVFGDLDLSSEQSQKRVCPIELIIKPNPEIKSGQKISFEDIKYYILDDGILAPIPVFVEVPPSSIEKVSNRRRRNCWGRTNRGGCLDFDHTGKAKSVIVGDIDLNVKISFKKKPEISPVEEVKAKNSKFIEKTDENVIKCRCPCMANCRAPCNKNLKA